MHLNNCIRKMPDPVFLYSLPITCLFLLLTAVVHASPWAEPGNIQLRHDLNLLRDTGHINRPLSTWPLSMNDVANAVKSVNEQSIQDPRVMDAFNRARRKLRQEKKTGFKKPRAKLSLTSVSLEYRTFMDTPRGKGGMDLNLEWMGKGFALNLEGQGIYDPDDDRNFRPDGTMGGVILGNWMLSAGYMSRWWGPSPLDSLILSSNARPFPAISIQRNLTEPFDLPVLNYLGRWDFRLFAGLLEEDRHISRPKFFGMRVDFCLTDKLEIGLSRTMQWGGHGEPEKLEILAELTFIPNNLIDEVEGTGSNQLAGYDVRWRSPFYGDFPYALYGQYIAEDVMHGRPIKYFGQAGIEHWGTANFLDCSYRIYAEVADTMAQFYRSPEPNHTYNHKNYKTGYRYWDKSLGHGMDNDSVVYTLGGSLLREGGITWNGFLRFGRINRDKGGYNSISPNGEDIWSGQLSRSFDSAWGRISLSSRINYTIPMQDNAKSDTEILGFISWQNR